MANNAETTEQAGVEYQALEEFVERRIRLYQQGIKGGPEGADAPRVTKRDLVTMWVTLRNVPGTGSLRSRIDETVGVVGNEVCEGCGIQVDTSPGTGTAEPEKARPLETGVSADQDCPRCGAPL